MRAFPYALLSSASFAALAVATPANAQTPQPANPGGDPCQVPAENRDPSVTCPPADTPAGEAVQAGEATTAASDQGIVVVGSRIRRDRFNTADPVTIITRDAAVDAGFNSTAQVLQSVGVTGGTGQITDQFGGLVVDGGPGVNTLSLRGLGATRTLILLNGRRLAPAGTRGSVGSADLNVLPTAILDRIEVLNTGASSIYGSDAVAGVVNIVTRSKFNGLSLEATINAPEVGAGTEQRYSATFGTSGERFSLVGSLEYYKRTRITVGDLPWARCGRQLRLSGAGTRRGSGDYIDPRTGEAKCFPLEEGGVTVNTIGTNFTFLPNGSPILAPGFEAPPPPTSFGPFSTYCTRWRPNPAQLAGPLPGYECVGGFFYNANGPGNADNLLIGTNTNLRDTFSPAILQTDIISPARTYTGFLSGTYDTDFFGDGQLYAELLATRRKSQQNGQRQFTLDYARRIRDASGVLINNPLLSPALFGVSGVNSTIGIRVFADYGIYDSSQTQDYVKLSGGFRGDIPFLSKWRYDLYASKSWADGTYSFEQILADRLAQSLDVIAGTTPGTFRCRNTAGGCVAAPVLTPAIVAGQFRTAAPAWFDYVTDDVVGHTAFREHMFNLTVDGPLFRLQGGDASMAAGVEYRKSSINDVPSADAIRNNLYNFSSAPITRGSDAVREAFAEIELPIFRDLPFAHNLTLNGSTRFTDYDSYGSDWTYKFGGQYLPVKWLAFRGSYGTSFRAPALFEQFLGSTTGFLASTTDVCDNLSTVSTNPAILATCQSQGLPLGFRQNNGVTVIGRGGAEAGLKAETSKNLTLGMVFQPALGPDFGNFSLAVDYYKIEVNNGVAQLGVGTLLQGCYTGARPEYCQFISRAPYTGQGTGALTVTQTYINIATDIAKGIDIVARYDRDLGPGKLDIGAQAVRTLDRINQVNPDSSPTDFAGSIGNPKWAGLGHVGYEVGPWYFRWGTEYIGKSSDNSFAGFDPNVYDFSVNDYWLHTATIRYEKGPYSLTAGVRNVFDRDPPKITAEDPFVNTLSNVPLQSAWDFRGRTFFVNARAKVF